MSKASLFSLFIFAISTSGVFFLYSKLNEIEKPERGFIDSISPGIHYYLIKSDDKTIGRMKSQYNPGVVKATAFTLELQTKSLVNQSQTYRIEIVLFANPIDQVFNTKTTIDRNGANLATITSKGIDVIMGDITINTESSNFTKSTKFKGPILMLNNSDSSVRIEYPKNNLLTSLVKLISSFKLEKISGEDPMKVALNEIANTSLDITELVAEFNDIENFLKVISSNDGSVGAQRPVPNNNSSSWARLATPAQTNHLLPEKTNNAPS